MPAGAQGPGHESPIEIARYKHLLQGLGSLSPNVSEQTEDVSDWQRSRPLKPLCLYISMWALGEVAQVSGVESGPNGCYPVKLMRERRVLRQLTVRSCQGETLER